MIKDLNELTPVEEYNGIYYKRDDLFQPFDDIPLSGGKVRQALCLIRNQLDNIRNNYNNTVITGTSVQSPQGIIVARAAKEYGVKSILVFGNTDEEHLKENNLTHNAMIYADRIDTRAGMAYENVLFSRICNICEEDRKVYFLVKFGINLDEDKDAIIDSVANQCANIPNDVEQVVVPAGSAIMLGGIIKGCRKFNKNVHIIGVQISGYDRIESVWNILDYDETYKYDFIIDHTYPYSKHLNIEVVPGFRLDPVYEAKAYDYMLKHIDTTKKTLFWVVGDSNAVRENYFGS